MNSKLSSKASKIKAVIFDAGGVLVLDDRDRTKWLNFAHVWKYYHAQPLYDEMNLGIITLADGMKQILGQPNGPGEKDVNAFLFQARKFNYPLWVFAQKLKSDGYKIGICSNNPSALFKRWDSMWHIAKGFDKVVVSADIGVMKPNKKIYQMICQKLKVKPAEAVFIDDLIENVRGAERAGLKAIQFTDNRSTIEMIKEIL